MTTFDTILALIEDSELEQAIEELKKTHRTAGKFKEVVLVAAWFNEFQSNANSGALSYEQQALEKNRIRRALIELLPDEKPVAVPEIQQEPMAFGAKNIPAQTPSDFFGSHIKQVKFRLFEGGTDCPVVGQRVYLTSFPQNVVRYIWWEIELVCLPPEMPVPFELTFFYYNSAGNIMGDKGYTYPMQYPALQTVWLYWWGWGYVKPGQWQAGKYKVEVYAGSHLLATSEFSLV